MRAGAFAAAIAFGLLLLGSGSLQSQEDRPAQAEGDRGSPIAIEEGTTRGAGTSQRLANLDLKWLHRWRARQNYCPRKITEAATPLQNSRSPSEVTGPCPGGCGGQSCCDCSKSIPPSPNCCISCAPPSKACCIVGGTAGCLPADGCCSMPIARGAKSAKQQTSRSPLALARAVRRSAGERASTPVLTIITAARAVTNAAQAPNAAPAHASSAPSGDSALAPNRSASARPTSQRLVSSRASLFASTSIQQIYFAVVAGTAAARVRTAGRPAATGRA
jgi:hypothetical protein